MRVISSSSLILLVILSGCRQEHSPVEADSEFDRTKDFGVVSPGDVCKHAFIFQNISDQSILPVEVGVSCSCTTAEIAKDIIPPGGSGTLMVALDVGVQPADIRQEVVVSFENREPMRFAVLASVRNGIYVDRRSVDAQVGSTSSTTFWIGSFICENNTGELWDFPRVVEKPEFLTASFTLLANQASTQRWRCDLTANTYQITGEALNGSIEVVSPDRRFREQVGITLAFTPELIITPKEIVLGRVKFNEGYVQILTLDFLSSELYASYLEDGVDFFIEGGRVSADRLAEDGNGHVRFRITLNVEGPLQPEFLELTIGDVHKQSLPLVAFYDN